MKCRLAHKKDLPSLKAIWDEVFLEHEPQESIDFYFANNFDLEHTFVLENDAKVIVSTLQLNQHEIMVNRKKMKVSFVVGVATLEKEQRKGYMRKLLDYAIKYAQETLKQELMILQAYNWDVYRAFGFYDAYYKSEVPLLLEDLKDFKEAQQMHIDSKLLLDIYEKYTADLNGYKIRDIKYFDKHQKALAVDKTQIAASKDAYLFYQISDDQVIVSETAYTDKEALYALVKSVLKINSIPEAMVNTDIKHFNDKKVLFMMVKNLTDKEYLIDDSWYISEWI